LSPTASIAENALRQMRSMIDDGRFGDQSRLPPERELAAELRVGRSTLRKALEILEAEGQIWRHVGQGLLSAGTRRRSRPARAISQRRRQSSCSTRA